MTSTTFVDPPLIPREALFGNPEKASPQVSPDGARLAYLAPDEGVLNLWVRTAGQQDDRPVTRDRKRGVRMYGWAYDSRHLCYIQDLDGDENWHVWSVDLETNVIRDLTPFQGVQAHIAGSDPGYPNTLLVALNLRDPRAHDVYRVDLTTGAVVLDTENPGDVVDWTADGELVVRACTAMTPDGGFELRVRGAVCDGWRAIRTWGPDESEPAVYLFASDPTELYIGSSLGADTRELRILNTATDEESTLAGSPEVDLGEVLIDPVARRILAAEFEVGRARWVALDAAVEEDMRVLQEAIPGDLHIASRDLAARTWVVLGMRDTAPPAYYSYDRETKRTEFLFSTRPALEKFALAEMRAVPIRARDGLTLHSYLTVPPGVEPKNLPLVLNVHGGPWARDAWGYDPEAQWLANRGYACLQVNFRGSSGFGKRFLHAGDREWGARMHDDLIDAVNWAVGEGIADPARVAIYGGSYGGYAALVGAAFTPDVFCCSVDIVGPSNLSTLINSIPPYWEPMKKLFTTRVGDPETDADFLDSRSPLFKADRIECPMLIAQGANDPRVKQAESEQIVDALRKKGKPVEYMLFEDEGHGFARPENRLRFYAAAEKFLAKHLGGRAEE